jgi:predicted amidohydrolase
MAEQNTDGPEYIAVALQIACSGLKHCPDRPSAQEHMLRKIETINGYVTTATRFLNFFYGAPVRLVGLPEFSITGFPIQESPAEWRDKACFHFDGPEYEALGKIANDNNVYLAGNAYEIDRNFPQLYFQTCFIIGPSGDVVLRYRRLTSTFEPTPHDVWDKYLDIYGLDGVFPVARTEIGNLAMIASEEILYPEITRCHVMRGAEVILHPTSEPGSPQLTYKEICRRARAIENIAYVIAANTSSLDDMPIPPYTCSAMSKIVDYNGHVLVEAGQGGESMSANAVIDIGALRRTRRRRGMANILSRQAFDLYADSYTETRFHAANSMLHNGKVRDIPDKDFFRKRQEANIERLVKAGLL